MNVDSSTLELLKKNGRAMPANANPRAEDHDYVNVNKDTLDAMKRLTTEAQPSKSNDDEQTDHDYVNVTNSVLDRLRSTSSENPPASAKTSIDPQPKIKADEHGYVNVPNIAVLDAMRSSLKDGSKTAEEPVEYVNVVKSTPKASASLSIYETTLTMPV